MIPKQLDLVTPADILLLIADGRREDRTIEYKQELPTRATKDRNEFLYDVSAFANAGGGDLIYGVSEAKDADGRNTGLPAAAPGLDGENADEAVRRLHSMIATGLDPAIPGLRVQDIGAGSAGGPIIVVRVPQSWAAPHMVSVDGLSRFYVRMGPAKQMLDREGIRRAFAGPEASRVRLERFRDQRLGSVLADEAPYPLAAGYRTVLHVVPLSALEGGRVDLSLVYSPYGRAAESSLNAGPLRYNFDGLAFRGLAEGAGVTKYVQCFHSGAVELVLAGPAGPGRFERAVSAAAVQYRCIEVLRDTLAFYQGAGVPPPAYVMLALLSVKGYWLSAGSRTDFISDAADKTIDRHNLVFPEVRVDDWHSEAPSVLRPLFDGLWQAAGKVSCLCYDAAGQYTPPA